MHSVLITGGSRGIGRATAIACGARGWSVGVNFLSNTQAADQTADAVRAKGGQAVTLQGDVAEEADIIAVFQSMKSAMGGLNGVVVNAGIVAPKSLLVDMELARLRRMFDVNILGAVLCAREAARHLARDRGGSGGSIVLVSSTASRLGSAFDYVDYAASKGAIDTLTRGLAKELAPQGVRVNAVRPGLVETEIHASGGRPNRARQLGASTPLGRAGEASEIAEAIVWLLSDASSYATGAILDVAGGI